MKEAISNQQYTSCMDNLENTKLIIKTQKKSYYPLDNPVKIQFWAVAKLPGESDYYKLKQENSLNFEFDSAIFDKKIDEYCTYQIEGYVSKDEHCKKDGGYIYKRFFEYIKNIEILDSPLIREGKELSAEKIKLESKGWERSLTPHEKETQNREIENIKNMINFIDSELNGNTNTYKSLIPVEKSLKQLLKTFSDYKVKKNIHFPGSMTFIQNPAYQGVHKLYKKIMDSSGLDTSLFDSLLEAQKIGVLDIPLIYERWCLLQIITVLIDKFHFTPQEGWKQSLLNQVLTLKKDIVLNFKNDAICREVRLTYEKELRSGKRPDFVLDITSSFNEKKVQRRFVMDAKFYEKIDISRVVDELYNEKNYAEKSERTPHNKVFILHPSPEAVPNRKTPQHWSINSYYGETPMFDWDEDKPNKPSHQYGAILLSPIKRSGADIDDLQRLIGMFLQYGLENNDLDHNDLEYSASINPMLKEKLFCIACGSDQYSYEEKTQQKGVRWDIKCDRCNLYSQYNYCWNCHHRLIKNGIHWSYHATQALEPYNIKCPNCGKLQLPKK